MSSVLGRLGAAFLAPSPTAGRHQAGVGPQEREPHGPEGPPPSGAPSVAVLARAGDAWVAGGAVALALRASTAVVAGWGAPLPSMHAPAAPGARRLAARLGERGHATRATGRLVLVALAADADADAGVAVTEAERIEAAAGDGPVVRVFAGARDEHVDHALAVSDRVVVTAAAGDDAVARLTAELLGADVLCVDAPATARGLAATGVALTAPLRQRAEAALRGLG